MPYKVRSTKQECEHGCGSYAVNKDGTLRRHAIGGSGCIGVCERACVGVDLRTLTKYARRR